MSIEAMKQALEACEGVWNGGLPFHHVERMGKTIKALRQAIAEAEKQEQGEPVGEMTPRRAEMFMSRFKHEEKMLGPNEQAALDYVIAMLVAKQEQGEPVAWMYPDALCDRNCLYLCTKGFTQFPECATTPQQRKPLTDEQIDKAMAENKQTLIDAADNYWKMRRAYARIIEAAHGIKE